MAYTNTERLKKLESLSKEIKLPTKEHKTTPS